MVSSLIYVLRVLFVSLAIQLHNYGILGCVEEERIGLLKLKEAFVNYRNGSDVLSSWGGVESNCCMWENVKCDFISKRVLQLSLGYMGDSSVGYWDLNLSLFHPFQELQNLSLTMNSLTGFHGALTSSKLQNLDLSYNWFSEIPSLGTLHSLKRLYIQANRLNISIFQELIKLSALEILNLAYNIMFPDQILPSLETMTSLKAISLRENTLNGILTDKGLCRLRNLEALDLNRNSFSGLIPSCLNNLTSLKFLDLSENNLAGTIPSTLFLNLKSLEYVSLSSNYFEGSFSLSSFGNNSKLEVLEINNLNDKLNVCTENSPTPLFQLKSLQLSRCKLNEPASAIPSFLMNQYNLRFIMLEYNGMVGDFPNWLFINNTNLEVLILRNNLFTGPFSLHPDTRNLDLIWLDISENLIHGQLPNFIGSVLPNTVFLQMSLNEFQGLIPPSIGEMKKLKLLDLSNNNLSGDIPELLILGCTSLQLLKLSNNNLQGSLLPVNSNLSSMISLYLDNNNFSKELLLGLHNSAHLLLLDITNNSISGEIPDWLGEFSELNFLGLSHNFFEGRIPASMCRLQTLSSLDLSHNKFFGVIPSFANLSSLRYLHLQGNKLTGPLPRTLSRQSSLVILDLTDNKLSGNLPDWISSLSSLMVLLLKGNYLDGSIPIQICNLRNISILDLSFNNFSGLIPACLYQIAFAPKIPPDHYASAAIGGLTTGNVPTYLNESGLGSNPNEKRFFMLRVMEEKIEFMSKSRFESYIGDILYYISGLDLSSNKLTGPIPNELGSLTDVQTLNLSHNHLSGLIPTTLSKLTQLQSLDLSYNKLSGQIPPELTELNFLEDFSVAYNNLSGRLPDRKAQFGTFDESSYEGNPLLCGPPLKKSCNTDSNGQSPSNVMPPNSGEADSFRDAFLLTFLVSFVAAFSGIISFLYICAYYRKRLFGFIEAKIGVFQ